MGYYRAGFTEIVGVDVCPMPRYPFSFVQADALEYLSEHGHKFDAIHASPPCKKFNCALNIRVDTDAQRDKHEDLITPTRELLKQLDIPYVIENVPGAPLINPGILCGQMFDTKVIRHRLFETSFPVDWPSHVPHRGSCAGGELCTVAGMGGAMKTRGGDRRKEKRTLEAWREAMGISWMQKYELTQAIPPAYTQFLGEKLLAQLTGEVHVKCADWEVVL
ncbi:hypothetical protein IAD21_00929 [Abditibacteriota bacterium]|nr:hypothetical protein IAD21_00929 [Abditibacteriota bacterium]